MSKDEEISHPDCGTGVEILPRCGVVYRLTGGSNSPSFIVCMGNYILRHTGRKERVCPGGREEPQWTAPAQRGISYDGGSPGAHGNPERTLEMGVDG